ncbi:BZ3500_MvSof-1268-A1-R1_Chr1-3g02079 [Microbotryum saponariae]|uniref:BZ3500_MvSof-1268-A1-R1_Chr1-3g02079 protein n=1 Tax=Microbotryum saponariae TaxID=289078 RepID=A0A2X0KW83_9BASI|nr:BZ3500_MvSof-1268-A1-R1_Chr1-3g02079 [Microbotryum saponariae]
MATLSELIGFSPSQGGTFASTSKLAGVIYPNWAGAAKELGTDVRAAYVEALQDQQARERQQDRDYLDRAHEFVELNEQVDVSCRRSGHHLQRLRVLIARVTSQTSTSLLKDLSAFLSTFQQDLSAVSGHVADLQGRSKTIEGRLQARKAVERSLHPYLESITLSPPLIHTIIETPVGDHWIDAIPELDQKLGAIRSGPRIQGRKALDEIAEALRVAAAQKILTHLVSLIKPFTTSINSPLSSLQTFVLLPLKPLFDFLRRHAARQAHEFQKAYTNTMRWYYETGFRRYVRTLEKVRVKGVQVPEPIGVVGAGADGGLSLLAKRPANQHPSATPTSATGGLNSAIANSRVEGGPPIMTVASTTDKTSTPTKPSPEYLFRSASLVMSDNAETEYAFLSTFFGTHSSLNVNEPRTPSLFAAEGANGAKVPRAGDTSTASWISVSGPGQAGTRTPLDEDESGSQFELELKSNSGLSMSTSNWMTTTTREEKSGRLNRTVVEGLWKLVMEPAQEYMRNFTAALLDPASPPSPIALLSMIRLNEALLNRLVSAPPVQVINSTAMLQQMQDEAEQPLQLIVPSIPTCPAMEAHLISIRMQLWPLFVSSMKNELDSIKAINGSGSGTTSSMASMFGSMTGAKTGTGGAVKDSVVRIIIRRYADMFNTVLELAVGTSNTSKATTLMEGDDHPTRVQSSGPIGEDHLPVVFDHLIKLRNEVDKLLVHQADKIQDPDKRGLFLKAHYQEIGAILSGGSNTSHSKSQSEVAHYRELARKLM